MLRIGVDERLEVVPLVDHGGDSGEVFTPLLLKKALALSMVSWSGITPSRWISR